MHIEGVQPHHLSSGDNPTYSTAQALGYAIDDLTDNVTANLQQYLQVAVQANATPQEVYPPMQNFLASVVGNMDILHTFLSAVFPNSPQISKDIAMINSSISTLSQSIQNDSMPLSSTMNDVNTLAADVSSLNDDVTSQAAKTPVSLSTFTTAFETVNTYTLSDLNILLHQPAKDVDPYMASELLGITSVMSQLQICLPTSSINYSNVQSYLKNITADLTNSPIDTADIANEMAAIRTAIST